MLRIKTRRNSYSKWISAYADPFVGRMGVNGMERLLMSGCREFLKNAQAEEDKAKH